MAFTQSSGSALLESVRKVQNSKYDEKDLLIKLYSIVGYGFVKTFDNPSIFSQIFGKLPKKYQKKKKIHLY